MNDSLPQITISYEQEFVSIPYLAKKHDDGETFPYYSLLKKPEKIKHIPELKGEKELTNFIKHIHKPKGIFETFRCLHYYDEDKDKNIQRRIFVLGFLFRSDSCFQYYSNCISFSGNLLDLVSKGKIVPGSPFRLDIQHARHSEKNCEGFVMDLYFSGVGESKVEANRQLCILLQQAKNLFLYGKGNF